MYFETPRDIYESYVISNFVSLMIEFMGGEELAHGFFSTQPPLPHSMPFSCLAPHDMTSFLRRCKLCTLQYSLIKPLVAGVQLLLHWTGDSRHPIALWLTLITSNVSATLALYYLIYFHKAATASARFQAARPVPKLLSIKLVIFFSFWQFCILDLLGHYGVLNTGSSFTAEEMEVGHIAASSAPDDIPVRAGRDCGLPYMCGDGICCSGALLCIWAPGAPERVLSACRRR